MGKRRLTKIQIQHLLKLNGITFEIEENVNLFKYNTC